ncbi:MAG TPA: RNA methyltransferase PUA domain-containing protein [Euzebyales bacterium]
MATPHVFVEPADCADGRVVLRDDVAHHVLTVLRRRVGDPVSVADGTGTVRRAVISSTSNGTAVCAVTAETHAPSPPASVRVVCGLPKRRKLDEGIQRLSPTIMRADMAAVVAPALVLHRLGRLG